MDGSEFLPCSNCLGDPARDDAAGSLRCICGCLLARLVPGGVELKCRRCKRTCFVPFQAEGSDVAPAGSRS